MTIEHATIKGYFYDSGAHCVACAQEAAAIGLLRRVPPLSLTTDAHGLTRDLQGRDGDAVRRVFTTGDLCSDCNNVLA